MKMGPKTKRSYGKRKPISVPELLAVRVEMTSEEAVKSEQSSHEVSVDVIVPATHEGTELITTESAEYVMAGVPEISVYEDVQEINWIEHSQIKVKILHHSRLFSTLSHKKIDFRRKPMTLVNWKPQRYSTSMRQLTMSSSPNTAASYCRTTSLQQLMMVQPFMR